MAKLWEKYLERVEEALFKREPKRMWEYAKSALNSARDMIDKFEIIDYMTDMLLHENVPGVVNFLKQAAKTYKLPEVDAALAKAYVEMWNFPASINRMKRALKGLREGNYLTEYTRDISLLHIYSSVLAVDVALLKKKSHIEFIERLVNDLEKEIEDYMAGRDSLFRKLGFPEDKVEIIPCLLKIKKVWIGILLGRNGDWGREIEDITNSASRLRPENFEEFIDGYLTVTYRFYEAYVSGQLDKFFSKYTDPDFIMIVAPANMAFNYLADTEIVKIFPKGRNAEIPFYLLIPGYNEYLRFILDNKLATDDHLDWAATLVNMTIEKLIGINIIRYIDFIPDLFKISKTRIIRRKQIMSDLAVERFTQLTGIKVEDVHKKVEEVLEKVYSVQGTQALLRASSIYDRFLFRFPFWTIEIEGLDKFVGDPKLLAALAECDYYMDIYGEVDIQRVARLYNVPSMKLSKILQKMWMI